MSRTPTRRLRKSLAARLIVRTVRRMVMHAIPDTDPNRRRFYALTCLEWATERNSLSSALVGAGGGLMLAGIHAADPHPVRRILAGASS